MTTPLLVDQRTEQLTDDILDIAAVVVGDERINLVGWQRHNAILAMTALGYSKTHIAWALDTTVGSIDAHANQNRIRLHRFDQRPDWIAIDMVVHTGARMPLRGIDRIEAIRALAAQGRFCLDIAKRIETTYDVVKTIADRAGIALPDAPKPDGWSVLNRSKRRRKEVAAA